MQGVYLVSIVNELTLFKELKKSLQNNCVFGQHEHINNKHKIID